MKRVYPLLFLVLTMCCLCFHVNGQELSRIKIDPKEANEVDLEQLAVDIQVVKLENANEAIFGEVGKLLVTASRLYIMTGMPHPRVFAFNREGKYLFKVLPTGQGPGEVNRIANIAVDGEDLMVYGDLSRKVLRYTAAGDFQKEYKLDFFATNFIKTESGWLFYLMAISAEDHDGTRLVSTDESFKSQTYFYRPKPSALGFASSQNQFMPIKGGARFIVSQSDTIMNVSGLRVRSEYFVDFGKYALSKSLKEREYSRDNMARIRKSNYAILGSSVLTVSGLTGLVYAQNNPNGDKGKRARRLYIDLESGETRWHFYRLNLERFQARMPFNNFAFEGKAITTASFLELFEFNKRESKKKSRSGISEGFGVLSLDEAMKVMRAEDNPYLFFYSIRN